MSRSYYSARKTKSSLTFEKLRTLFGAVYSEFLEKQFFDEAFGYRCVDEGTVYGSVGGNPERFFFLSLRKAGLWPIEEKLHIYSEDDLFDVIELLSDLVSEPVDGTYHDFRGCGMHYSTFNQPSGRSKFRAQINEILSDYETGYELAENGEIVERAEKGFESLMTTSLPISAANLQQNVDAAIEQFRRRGSSVTDRHNAVRMLADVLEVLRPKLTKAITKKDESDLFNIANNFGIRHKNDKQKVHYEKSLWLSWMFYYYLATIHFATRRLD